MLHSSLSVEEQDKAFDIAPDGVRKCIISYFVHLPISNSISYFNYSSLYFLLSSSMTIRIYQRTLQRLQLQLMAYDSWWIRVKLKRWDMTTRQKCKDYKSILTFSSFSPFIIFFKIII